MSSRIVRRGTFVARNAQGAEQILSRWAKMVDIGGPIESAVAAGEESPGSATSRLKTGPVGPALAVSKGAAQR